MDAGEVASHEEAIAILRRYGATVYLGPEVRTSASLQAALLTLVNAGARCLLGGINVIGCADMPRCVSLPGPPSLRDSVLEWGGHIDAEVNTALPGFVLGTALPRNGNQAPSLQVTFDRWLGAVGPVDARFRLPESEGFPPAGILAGALAVSECFQFFGRRIPSAMRRTAGFSLWRPDVVDPWDDPEHRGPAEILLPQKVWVVGLGNLGQAFLWSLLACRYPNPTSARITLQDYDRISDANRSTSLLSQRQSVGRRKTRVMADYCDAAGLDTVLVERPFDDKFVRSPEDPPLAFCGVDTAAPRRMLEAPGFMEIIEAGLGARDEYLEFQIHSLPGSRSAKELWPNVVTGAPPETVLQLPAYRNLLERGQDRCGVLEIAGAAVSVPFAGVAVASIAIGETVRAVMQQHRYELIDGSLRDLRHLTAIPRPARDDLTNLWYVRPAQ